MTHRYTLLVKSDEGDGYFTVPINLTGDEVDGAKVARIKDALTIAKDMQIQRAESRCIN
jgi:hypothetical protein